MFAFERAGITPDLVTLGKALSSGPLSPPCRAGRHPEAVAPGMHTSSFQGNPLSCAVATATLESLDRFGLVERAATVLEPCLAQGAFPLGGEPGIAALRVIGAQAAIDLGPDGADRAAAVQRAALREGYLLYGGGASGECVMLLPPLVIGVDDLSAACAASYASSGRRVDRSQQAVECHVDLVVTDDERGNEADDVGIETALPGHQSRGQSRTADRLVLPRASMPPITTPHSAASPRTSRTPRALRRSSWRVETSAPMALARSGRLVFDERLDHRKAVAAASGFQLECRRLRPGRQLRNRARVPATRPAGMPPPRLLARTTRSASRPRAGDARRAPVRPNPVNTSSAIRQMPWRRA